MIELELKAHVEDPSLVRAALKGFAFQGAFDREDTYWFPLGEAPTQDFPASGVRVRRETGLDGEGLPRERCLITFKRKEIREGIEVNDESEFQVSGAGVFEALLRLLALAPGKGKRKRGTAWTREGVTAELSLVEGLGWFIELEILSGEGGAEAVSAARERLFGLLSELGVPESAVEPRYYTEMLEEEA